MEKKKKRNYSQLKEKEKSPESTKKWNRPFQSTRLKFIKGDNKNAKVI